jgi:hypothetical protein
MRCSPWRPAEKLTTHANAVIVWTPIAHGAYVFGSRRMPAVETVYD